MNDTQLSNTPESPSKLSSEMGAQLLLHLKNTMFLYRCMDEASKAEVVRRCPLFQGIAEDSGLFQAAMKYVGWNRDVLQNRLLGAALEYAKEWLSMEDGQEWVKGDGKRLTEVNLFSPIHGPPPSPPAGGGPGRASTPIWGRGYIASFSFSSPLY
jgi:hypothetical protein